MKEKALFSILLLCMIVSTIVMVVVLSGIDSVRARSTTAGPGGFNSLNQLDHALDKYSNALDEYRFNIGDPEQMNTLSAEYQNQFNIIWGNLEYFNIRLPEQVDENNQFANFKHDAQQFLQQTEAAMAADQILSADQVTQVMSNLRVLQDQVHAMGIEYFISSLSFRDNWVNTLNNLYKLLYIFGAALILAAGLLVALLIRSNSRKNALVLEAESARNELSSSIAELRSGRLEQRAKDSFIASASHDLSQPLHALGLFLGSLETHVKGTQAQETLHDAIECSNNLGYLFKSLMDISRLDAGVVEVENQHFHLNKLVVMLEHEFQVKAQDASININIQLDNAVVYSDPILLSRVVRNLIENAIVHSNANLITVSCSSASDYHQLIIEDNGRGISRSEQQRIFGEYYQINNNDPSAVKGLGLGLAIVNRLAELLNTKISLESKLGAYTRFSLRIPQGLASQVAQSTIPVLTNNVTKLTSDAVIAVIDDDENICVAMSLMLRNIGFDAITGTSTDIIIDKFIESEKLPDLIVADYRLLKGQTGDQAVVQLKRALNVDVPALLVTGDSSPLNIAHATNSGFDLMHKPIQPQELSRKIIQMLLVSRTPDHIAEPSNHVDNNRSIDVI